jgi:hypothetical protein
MASVVSTTQEQSLMVLLADISDNIFKTKLTKHKGGCRQLLVILGDQAEGSQARGGEVNG